MPVQLKQPTFLISNPDEGKSGLTESLAIETSLFKRQIKELIDKVGNQLKYSDLIQYIILLLSGRSSWSARYIQASWSS